MMIIIINLLLSNLFFIKQNLSSIATIIEMKENKIRSIYNLFIPNIGYLIRQEAKDF